MGKAQDATKLIRDYAADFPEVAAGTSCNQRSFKTGNGAFLFIGLGAKGIGYKAMFKLHASLPKARELAAEAPERFEVGKTGWVTVRFSNEKPLQKYIWGKWLRESYSLSATASGRKRKSSKKAAVKRRAN